MSSTEVVLNAIINLVQTLAIAGVGFWCYDLHQRIKR